MSLDVGSMPPWRQELRERKKRQEDVDRRRREEEEDKLAHMPTWKRDILLKKHQQKHNVIFISQAAQKPGSSPAKSVDGETANHQSDRHSSSLYPNSNSNTSYEGSNSVSEQSSDSLGPLSPTIRSQSYSAVEVPEPTTIDILNSVADEPQSLSPVYTNGDVSVGEEHLLPVQQNPWLRTDLEKRKKSQSKRSSSSNSVSNPASCDDVIGDYREQQENDNEEDNVFQEGAEFQYGRGFVNKLLRKFSHLSVQEEKHAHPMSTRRTHSSDNILEETRSTKYSPRSPPVSPRENPPSPFSTRARSMENLSNRTLSATATCTSDEVFNHIDDDDKPESQQTINYETESQDSSLSTLHEAGSDVKTCSNTSPRRSDSVYEKRSSSNRDSILEEELPKANIVSNVRNVFESISSSSDVGYTKKRAPEPPRADNYQQNGDKTGLVTNEADTSDQTSQVYFPGNANSGETVEISAHDHDIIANGTSDHINNSKDTTDSVTTASSYSFEKSPKETLANVKAAGKSWHFSGGSSSERNQQPVQDFSKSSNTKFSSASGTTDKVKYGQGKSVVYGAVSQNNSKTVSPKPASSNSVPSESVTVSGQSVSKVSTTRSVTPVSSTVAPPSSPSRKRLAPTPPSESAGGKHVTVIGLNNKTNTSRSYNGSNNVTTGEEKVPKTDNKRPDTSKLNLNLDLANSNTKNTAIDTNANLKLASSSHGTNDLNSYNHQQQKKKLPKRPTPSGPGKLIIRPASNLIIGETSNPEYTFKLTKYRDVTEGVFAPARQRPAYYDYEDWEGIPITNIDDVIGDEIPVTNIDDLELSPTWRQDANDNLVKPRKYVFEGAGVVSQSSIRNKSKQSKQMRLTFDDSVSTMFEYPSEQSLLEAIPPQPGDYDYPTGNTQTENKEEVNEPTTLKSTPGMGSAGSLSSYKGRYEMDFAFGSEPEEDRQVPVRPKREQEPEEDHLRPGDEDVTWSDSTSADLLF